MGRTQPDRYRRAHGLKRMTTESVSDASPNEQTQAAALGSFLTGLAAVVDSGPSAARAEGWRAMRRRGGPDADLARGRASPPPDIGAASDSTVERYHDRTNSRTVGPQNRTFSIVRNRPFSAGIDKASGRRRCGWTVRHRRGFRCSGISSKTRTSFLGYSHTCYAATEVTAKGRRSSNSS